MGCATEADSSPLGSALSAFFPFDGSSRLLYAFWEAGHINHNTVCRRPIVRYRIYLSYFYGIDPQFEAEPELLAALDEVVPADRASDFKDRIRRYEAALIAWALGACAGRRGDVATRLGIPGRTLRDRIRALGLE